MLVRFGMYHRIPLTVTLTLLLATQGFAAVRFHLTFEAAVMDGDEVVIPASVAAARIEARS